MVKLSVIASEHFDKVNIADIEKIEAALGPKLSSLAGEVDRLYEDWKFNYTPGSMGDLLEIARFLGSFPDPVMYELAPVVWQNREKLEDASWKWYSYGGDGLMYLYRNHFQAPFDRSMDVFIKGMRLYFEAPFSGLDQYLHGLSLYPKIAETGISLEDYAANVRQASIDGTIRTFNNNVVKEHKKRHSIHTDLDRFLSQAKALGVSEQDADALYQRAGGRNAYDTLSALREFRKYFPDADVPSMMPLLRDHVEDNEHSVLSRALSALKKTYTKCMDPVLVISKMNDRFNHHLESHIKAYGDLLRAVTPDFAGIVFSALQTDIGDDVVREIRQFHSHPALEEAFGAYLGMNGYNAGYPFEGTPLYDGAIDSYLRINCLADQGFIWTPHKLGILFSEPLLVSYLKDNPLMSYLNTKELDILPQQ